MSAIHRLLILCLFLNFSCNDRTKITSTTSSTLDVQAEESKPLEAKFDLVDYPEDFLKQQELEEWEDFKNLYESMDRLKELDLRGVEVNIIGITSRLKELLSKPLPKDFEVPQIKSRLKVVQMQAQKSRYFTRHYKQDSLVPSLLLLYDHYNALIQRMIVLKQEESTVVSNTLANP